MGTGASFSWSVIVLSSLVVTLPSMNSRLLCGILHFIWLEFGGSHLLFLGSCPGCQGNQGTFGRGGISQLILDFRGPLPLSSFGSVEGGIAFSLSRASGFFIELWISLERGTSSLFLIGEFPGNFIGEMGFLYFLFFLFILAIGGPHILVPDGPGLGSFLM